MTKKEFQQELKRKNPQQGFAESLSDKICKKLNRLLFVSYYCFFFKILYFRH